MWKFTGKQRPIIFELHVLPEYAIELDKVSGIFPNISEECNEWFWRFSICVGIPKHSSSKKVIKFTKEALKLIDSPTSAQLNNIKMMFPCIEPKVVIDSWKQSLLLMLHIAKNRSECEWFAPLYETDAAYTKNPQDILEALSRNLKKR